MLARSVRRSALAGVYALRSTNTAKIWPVAVAEKFGSLNTRALPAMLHTALPEPALQSEERTSTIPIRESSSSARVGANAALSAKINWLFMKARNLVTQTSSAQVVKADDGTTTVGTSTVSDDGTTATRGEFV